MDKSTLLNILAGNGRTDADYRAAYEFVDTLHTAYQRKVIVLVDDDDDGLRWVGEHSSVAAAVESMPNVVWMIVEDTRAYGQLEADGRIQHIHAVSKGPLE